MYSTIASSSVLGVLNTDTRTTDSTATTVLSTMSYVSITIQDPVDSSPDRVADYYGAFPGFCQIYYTSGVVGVFINSLFVRGWARGYQQVLRVWSAPPIDNY